MIKSIVNILINFYSLWVIKPPTFNTMWCAAIAHDPRCAQAIDSLSQRCGNILASEQTWSFWLLNYVKEMYERIRKYDQSSALATRELKPSLELCKSYSSAQEMYSEFLENEEKKANVGCYILAYLTIASCIIALLTFVWMVVRYWRKKRRDQAVMALETMEEKAADKEN